MKLKVIWIIFGVSICQNLFGPRRHPRRIEKKEPFQRSKYYDITMKFPRALSPIQLKHFLLRTKTTKYFVALAEVKQSLLNNLSLVLIDKICEWIKTKSDLHVISQVFVVGESLSPFIRLLEKNGTESVSCGATFKIDLENYLLLVRKREKDQVDSYKILYAFLNQQIGSGFINRLQEGLLFELSRISIKKLYNFLIDISNFEGDFGWPNVEDENEIIDYPKSFQGHKESNSLVFDILTIPGDILILKIYKNSLELFYLKTKEHLVVQDVVVYQKPSNTEFILYAFLIKLCELAHPNHDNLFQND